MDGEEGGGPAGLRIRHFDDPRGGSKTVFVVGRCSGRTGGLPGKARQRRVWRSTGTELLIDYGCELWFEPE